MSQTNRGPRRRHIRLGTSLVAAAAIVASGLISGGADNTDISEVATWVPFESPAGGPHFGKLDPAALSY